MGREGLRGSEYSVDWTGLTLLQGGEVCRQNNKEGYMGGSIETNIHSLRLE